MSGTEAVNAVLDILTAILLLLGAYFSLVAGIGIIRFPDTLTRVHAGTKPQVFGLACILTAVILSTRNWSAIAIMLLILLFQMLTTPAAAHMIGRAAYRRQRPDDDRLFVDELEQAVELANQHPDQGSGQHPGQDADADDR
jgi:multicomponent Na+:H+ antiporter subunit G